MNRVLYAPVLFVFLCAAQQRTDTASFEVADIKPSNFSNPEARKIRTLPGGRIEVPGATLKELMIFAFSVQENAIMGLAKWMDNDRFAVVAKAPADSSTETLRAMLQSLLADRFQLTFHRVDKPISAYVLSRGKHDLKLQPSSGGRQACQWKMIEKEQRGAKEGTRTGDNAIQDRVRRRECRNTTMDELAKQLPGWGGIGIDRPVVNETGLNGAYDFYLNVGMSVDAKGVRGGGVPDVGSGIFVAFEQVGLKLESRKASVSVIVIDHAEPPTAN